MIYRHVCIKILIRELKMKILFVYPQYYLMRGIPLGISLLSALLKEEGHKIDLFDTTFMKSKEESKAEDRKNKTVNFDNYQFKKTPPIIEPEDIPVDIEGEFAKKIIEFQPNLIAFSVTTELWENAVKLIKSIKHNNVKIPIIVGGVHPTISPETVIEEADIVCVGEGEDAIVELCRNMQSGQDITKIQNLWVKVDKNVYKNPLRPLIDLNNLPCPDWSIFNERHLTGIYHGQIMRRGHYLSMRGCPFSCAYCTNNYLRKLCVGQGSYVRWEKVENTIRNLKQLHEKYHLDNIKFSDDLFIVRKEEELTIFKDEYTKSIGIPFLISVSPVMVKEEKLRILKAAGCIHLSIGIETGSYRIRKEILKRNVTDEQIFNAFSLANKVGIETSSFNMIGLPTETRKDLFKTIKLNKKCKVSTLNVYYLYPFPKTEIRDYCESNDLIPSDEAHISIYEGEKFNLSEIPLNKLRDLRKTFILYVKLSKMYYPLIRICESENKFSNWLAKKLYEKVQKRINLV